MKVAVVGASSGLGRCIAVGLGERGNSVALLARRKERLQTAAAEAGPSSVAIECDVTDELSSKTAIDEAAAELGGLDALVYATGIGRMGPLVDTTADTWSSLFATNVTGAALVTSAAIPHLMESDVRVAVYLSSLSASLTGPWPMLGGYAVSKAALDKLIEAFTEEHPDIGFTRLAVGDTYGGKGDSQTGFHHDWDPELFTESVNVWLERKLMNGGLIHPDHLVGMVTSILTVGRSSFLPSVTLTPRPPSRAGAPR
ncbi:SDR family oxidoreductase [uncultured Williamsia sp.]|uniref:SDR family oxidoreductase n=1 Tax=uncultured Williamsia sp. TaxID=259311 RepID=UPI0026394972|nr:SDR family oxidoreductase [uncultured Williamsia sp.]